MKKLPTGTSYKYMHKPSVKYHPIKDTFSTYCDQRNTQAPCSSTWIPLHELYKAVTTIPKSNNVELKCIDIFQKGILNSQFSLTCETHTAKGNRC